MYVLQHFSIHFYNTFFNLFVFFANYFSGAFLILMFCLHALVTLRRVARGAIAPTPSIQEVAVTIFTLTKLLMCKPKKCVSAIQRKCLKFLSRT